MSVRSIIWQSICAVIASAAALTVAVAQEPAPARKTAAPAEDVLFFREFQRAKRLVEQGGRAEAGLIINLLHNQLKTSPWMEVSLLKLSELLETSNDLQAMDGYELLRKRVANSPYFQRDQEKGRLFGTALNGAAEQGIRRIRLRRIRRGLERYFARFQQYPENLAKLAIFDMVDPEDILDTDNRPFRYLPTGQQFRPQIRYLRYELQRVRPEPFAPSSPRLDSTTLLEENPPVYGARISMPGRIDPLEIEEHQTIEGYYVVVIKKDGAVLCTPNRVIIIPARS
jgi:hypothetical protein